MRMYHGTEPCAGCGKTGKEVPRMNKNEMCRGCKDIYNLGKELKKDFRPKDYAAAIVTWYKLQYFNADRRGDLIEDGFVELLKVLQCKNVPYSEQIDLTKREATTHADWYIVRKEVAKALKKITSALEAQQADYSDAMKEVEKMKIKVANEERNKLFNEGVEHGKKMLFHLNDGSMSMEDFNKPITKY